ncbi:unnamed protein product [Macrosiphum euphorbiae]|uniref:Uncharacterized protein n=1 Tax=Macrosiphum euphorbiae TaxID=13131 RepID=A0AAV0YDH1_9HEMI|nr:unnamed protein product [Macrosiphum euphorbiae]
MSYLIKNGLNINGKIFMFELSQVVCDAPAKAFILNVKVHNAYHGCSSCIDEGSFINNRMSFNNLNSSLRTDKSFRDKSDEDCNGHVLSITEVSINSFSLLCGYPCKSI